MTQYKILAVFWNIDDDIEVDEKTEGGQFLELRVWNSTIEINLMLDSPSVQREISYFIHCLKNNKPYKLWLSNNNYMQIGVSHIAFYMIGCEKLPKSSICRICIPYSHSQQLIEQLERANYEISNDYINLMNRCIKQGTSLPLIFLRTKLNIDHDATTLIIDEFTVKAEYEFRKLLLSDTTIIFKNISYSMRDDTFECHMKPHVRYFEKEVLVDALNHILLTIDKNE